MSVFAWRTWETVNGQLWSTAATSTWAPGINEAACKAADYFGTRPPEHSSPALNCTCGYWAFKTPARLLREFGGWHGEKAARRVYGVVELAGQMVELELGYKAQYARIVALAAPEGMDVSSDYGVPVQRDLGELFRTWWDGVQPKYTEWAEKPDYGNGGYAAGGWLSPVSFSFQANTASITNAMRHVMRNYYSATVVCAHCSGEPDHADVYDNPPADTKIETWKESLDKWARISGNCAGKAAEALRSLGVEIDKVGVTPAAIRSAVVRSKADRPAWESTYGPSKGRR